VLELFDILVRREEELSLPSLFFFLSFERNGGEQLLLVFGKRINDEPMEGSRGEGGFSFLDKILV
jgi:hypothetical protein